MDAIHWPSVFFLLFAGIACAFALAVVFTQNIVRMALYLIASLGAVSGLFFLAGADFVGAMQLMIYVGGTLVLLVFGVMLTAQSQYVRMRTPSGQMLIALLVGASLLAVLCAAAVGVPAWRAPETAIAAAGDPAQTATPIGMALLGLRPDVADGGSRVGYLLVFEIISIHLLVVLVGAAYLARASRSRSSTN
ncbi:NADH-quinone oxidoreductase subunit J [Pirellulimonas nuda]|uniref:NADH-quinone oxidoreductase subunit J n=1 Tax=Pirellulimonas nuda TaxID=2528009 RepID=A0A518DGG0_9BACT|nr:NADH-quinone oxidoreductase subunit J [Pirellulimonas nuda]QDU90558.1 NADH-quinone oxidoreductase subunit J [Pirellulimonas nuda]